MPSIKRLTSDQDFAGKRTLNSYRALRRSGANGTGSALRSIEEKVGERISVTDFGAIGDFGNDDTAAIQAALDHASIEAFALNAHRATGQYTRRTVWFPFGVYKITAPLYLDAWVNIDAEHKAALRAPDGDTSFPLLVIQHYQTISHLAFVGGKHAIQIFGQRGATQWGHSGVGGLIQLDDITVQSSRREAIFLDPVTLDVDGGRAGTSAFLQVYGGTFECPMFLTGTFDQSVWTHVRLNGVPDMYHQEEIDLGTPINYTKRGLFNSAATLKLRDCFLSGTSVTGHDTEIQTSYMFRGRPSLTVNACNLGGDQLITPICMCDPDPGNTNDFRVDSADVYGDVEIAGSTIVAPGGPCWLQIFGKMPRTIAMRDYRINPNTGDPSHGTGIFVQTGVAIPQDVWLDLKASDSSLCRFFEGASPTASLLDVTHKFIHLLNQTTKGSGGEDLSVVNAFPNLLAAGVVSSDNLSTDSVFQLATGSPDPDLSSGYSLRTFVGSGGPGSISQHVAGWTPPDSAPGEYVFSLYMKADFSGFIRFSPGGVSFAAERRYGPGSDYKRIWWPFYHDGVTPMNLAIQTYNISVGNNLSYGKFMVNKGRSPAPYLYPGNPTALGMTQETYYGSAAPTSGTYRAGDRCKNTAPSAGGYDGWVCVVAGTPGTWKGYGSIQA